MRLTKIKLAGFKSFVDPTTVSLPGNLVGVVGPNGCGKSNVIDAVRWVMGESSAKHLRGGSMADVIFDGSNARKPVGTASVELVFDNTDGTLGGKYAGYNEISVKRQVNREGQSHYYLNGTRCRRRDITDVFLGTGLGPRSYSIIEQGMISRVIEARPEELRAYLEEAAGISIYKERRRETERRIRDTHENLERLNDVRDEVSRQLEKLKRQADTAERYKSLKAEERQTRAELLAIRLRDLAGAGEQHRNEIAERENAMEAAVAEQRGAEREIESQRASHAEQTDRLNEIQGRYYALGSDIARIEQQIAHRREMREKQGQDLARNEESIHELEQGIQQDEEKLAVIRRRLEELEPEQGQAEAAEAEASDTVAELQEQLNDWQERWEAFNRRAAEPVRAAEVERTRIDAHERRGHELEQRRERLQRELNGIALDDAEQAVADLREEEQALGERIAERAEQLEAVQQRLAELREQETGAAESLHEARGALQHDEARLTSLQTLQQAALGEDDGPLADWLQRRGWADNERLGRILDVADGWERAVEAILGETLQAVCVAGFDPAVLDAADLEAGAVTLVNPGAARGTAGEGDAYLASKVRAPEAVRDLLRGVRCAGSGAEARSLVASLAPGESVVTPDGVWLGGAWARVQAGAADEQAGVLERQREMARLESAIEQARGRIEREAARLEGVQDARADAERERDDVQAERTDLQSRQANAQAQRESRESRLEDARNRRHQLTRELSDLAAQVEEAESEVKAARARLQAALEQTQALERERETLTEEKAGIQDQLHDARDRLRKLREDRHELSLKLENASTAQQSLEQALTRMRVQHERAVERRDELREALDEEGEPEGKLEEDRERLLAQRLEVEQQLTDARTRLGEVENSLREQEERRRGAEQRVATLREELERARLDANELQVRRQTQQEQLEELGYDYRALTDTLPDDAVEDRWQKALEQAESRIQRLGPINLAAIDEYRTLDERKAYLDQQNDDLVEALETLESAIRRIDRETRNRFKETYEKVNLGVQRLFPRLFGGGQAYLEMTGDDLLETGIAVMARPPGKRVSNIHLLSGGEKALTAVSLVFAIFELNPAPFCMLDEVDAPLDEANVGRFNDMLKEMSRNVQFIVITHNKSTMENVTHLQGVTMNEPGVSRLVAVDVDEAVEMATA
ncbi:chromosome segregation protein SMC [Ectothiorhodospiraceae bacterium WFHF3C12]|nr:chromosome segregation protein SMC [Ectothiorhodospiraceae bacterium WFHF3C12]